MGGGKKLDWAASAKAAGLGSHVTESWLTEHGLLQAGGAYTDLTGTLSLLKPKIKEIEAQQMQTLTEDWAIKKRKEQKQGKSSLLTGGTTGLGSKPITSNSLLG